MKTQTTFSDCCGAPVKESNDPNLGFYCTECKEFCEFTELDEETELINHIKTNTP